jgi:co-chaperonin GroES (HSP10)
MVTLEKIIPRGNWILIRPVEKESQELESGLLVPKNEEQEQKAIGTVLGVGDKVTDIKENDKVIFGAFAGETLTRREDGQEIEYKLLLDEDIIAFLKN